MPTLGLALITNDEADTLALIEKYYPFFDKFFITVADKDKKLYDKLDKATDDGQKVRLSYFKWVDHFGKARRFNQTQVTTDYWMWMDSDDEIINPENLRAVVDQMVSRKADIMFMNYDYYSNDLGEQQANHWRERIIRTKSDCQWEDVPCHETVPAKGLADKTDLCAVKHHKAIDQMLKSMDRNQLMLEKDWKTHKDPRTAFYLGMTYSYHQKFKEAIKMYLFMINNGGWDEQKVVAWNFVSDCYFHLKDFDKALNAADEAMNLDPSHPDAYYHKSLIYTQLKQYDKATEWAETALTKKIKTDTMQLVDPTRYSYKALFLAAQANLFKGQPDKAFDYYNQAVTLSPQYIQQMNQDSGVNWPQTFTEAYNESNAINAIKYLVAYLRDRGGKLDSLFDSLPPKIVYDPRLLAEQQAAYPPKKWPEKSIVIYCGQGMEPWGPDTLKDGMGGSEEAVLYLSRELAELGWSVTVFCQRETQFFDSWYRVDNAPNYLPWTEFHPWDEFDVFIGWRRPEFVNGVKARRKLVDLHDTMPEESLMQVLDQVDQIMVKSPYHRSLYPHIPDDKISVVTNGIYKDLAYV